MLNPVTFAIGLAPGFPAANLESVSHPIQIQATADGRHRITLQEGSVFADRDFQLTWRPMPGAVPTASVFTEQTDHGAYVLLMLMPPVGESTERATGPREVIFVIDTSGSMYGDSINQAKAALRLALTRLSSHDRFNVIQFNSRTHALFPHAKPVTQQTLTQAAHYVDGLVANGGTEMASALNQALDGVERYESLRQVIFMTDGQAGNEDELFKVISQRLGDSRLFTVGIGSAPNSHFMRKAAEFGRGTFTYIGSTAEVKEKMDALFRKLEQPALTDLQLDPKGWELAEPYPARIPDLYVGEPLVVVARISQLPNRVILKGQNVGSPWKAEFSLEQTSHRTGLSVYWARQKIASLTDQQRTGGETDTLHEAVREAVIDVALQHHLVSKYTSLVAVDVTPARPDGSALISHALKNNLVHGQDYAHIFGLPNTATTGQLQILLGVLVILSAIGISRFRRSTT